MRGPSRSPIACRIIIVTCTLLAARALPAQPIDTPYRTPIGECAPFLYGGWEPIGPGEAGGLKAIAPHPTERNIILAGSDALGIQLSRDGGKTWRVCNKGIANVPPYFNGNAAYPLGWHPKDPRIAYATHAGGVYKSTDGGETWFQYEQNTPLRWPPVMAICLDPDDPETVYVLHRDGELSVTHDGCRTYEHLTSVPKGAGVVGRWRCGSYLSIDPTSPKDGRVLYAVSSLGVAVSRDGGKTWEIKRNAAQNGRVTNVLYIPNFEGGRGAIVAAFSAARYSAEEIRADPSRRGEMKSRAGVYVSFDGGDTWEARSEGLPVEGVNELGLLTYHPAQPRTLYVSTVRSGGYAIGAFKSVDGGRTWRLITRGYGPEHNMEFGWMSPGVPDLAAQTGPWWNNLMVLEISPVDPDLLYIRGSGRCGLMRSTDGGESWHQIYCDPVPGRPRYWRGRGANLAYGLSVGFDPSDPERIYLGLSDFGSLVSEDGGRSFRFFLNVRWYGPGVGTAIRYPDSERFYSLGDDIRRHIVRFDLERRRYFTTEDAGVYFKNDVFCTVVDPADSDIVYCTPGLWSEPPTGAILKSTDGASSYTILGPHYGGLPDTKTAAFSKLLLDPRGTPSKRRLYAAAGRFGVYRSDDAGGNWRSVSAGIPEGEIITDIALCSGQPDTLWAASGSNRLFKFTYVGKNIERGKFGHAFRTTDGGRTWSQAFDGPADIREIVAHPTDPDVAYIAAYRQTSGSPGQKPLRPGGVYKTSDDGRTWRHVFDQPTVTALVMSPSDSNTLYAGVTEIATGDGTLAGVQLRPGIYCTRDGGETWENVAGELRNLMTRYFCLGLSPADPDVLYVGCTGGFWRKRMQ